MTDARDPASLIEAAQKAVDHGRHSDAERLLREAAAIQEATLGGDHPDLAATLNNLAYVCEQTGNIDDAERGYRRAHRIAVASLSPGHPFLKTSLSNLMEFCDARGIPIWTRPEMPVEDEPLPDEIAVDISRDHERATDEAGIESFDVEPNDEQGPAIEAPPAIMHEPARAGHLSLPMMAFPALVIVAIVVVAFARHGNEANDEPRPVAFARTTTVPSAPVAPAPSGTPVSSGTAPAPPRAPQAPPKPRPALGNARASVTVLNAQLCSALAKRGSPDWQCTSADSNGPPGIYTYYTRVLTTAGTTVEHRWYFTGRVHQTMRLRVSPNPVAGYRTFSTTTVSPERAGTWKVELRAADGTVLDEAQFAVR